MFNGEKVTMEYDAMGRLSRQQLPNGSYSEYAYDSLGVMVTVANKSENGDTISSFHSIVDSAGNRIRTVENTGTCNEWRYNTANYLIYEIRYLENGDTAYAYQYDYDSAGNRLYAVDLISSESIAYTYDNGNRLTAAGDISCGYDLGGNVVFLATQGDSIILSWNADNRLATIADSSTTVNYIYDGMGRRIQKVTRGVMTQYCWDGLNVIGEYDSTGALCTRYFTGRTFDDLYSVNKSSQQAYFHRDNSGNVTELTDSTGAVINRYRYQAFGKVCDSSVASMNNERLYSGFPNDTTILNELYYVRARYYVPSLARWLSWDPLRFGGSTNFYEYCHNAPTVYSDRSGLVDCGPGEEMKWCWRNPQWMNDLRSMGPPTYSSTGFLSRTRAEQFSDEVKMEEIWYCVCPASGNITRKDNPVPRRSRELRLTNKQDQQFSVWWWEWVDYGPVVPNYSGFPPTITNVACPSSL